jgi:xylulokinase
MLWMDGRGREQLERAVAALGEGEIRRVTGLRAGANFTAPKAAWLREHEQSSFARVRWLLQPKDFLLLRLVGCAVTDPSSASRFLAYDRLARRWWPEMLEALDLSPGLLPRVVDSDGVAGHVTPEAAMELGLLAGIPVAAGAADRAAEALGLGIETTEVMVSTGTATGVVQPIGRDVAVTDPAIITPFHAVRDEVLAILSQPTSGVVFDWFARLVDREGDLDHDTLLARLAIEAEASPPGSNGLLVLPHFMGARSIRWEPATRGAVLGLTLATTRGDIARAIVEGVSFEIAACLEHLSATAGPPARLVLTGGANRTSIWAQTLVDVAGVEGVRYADRDGSLAGAMVLAGGAIGAWSDLRGAARGRLHTDALLTPDPDRHALYRRLRETYEDFYSRVV